MNIDDGIIDKWAEQAMENLGEKTWREVDTNSLLLVIYSIQKTREKKLVSKITKPIWWLLGAVGTGVLYFIISTLFI